MSRIPSPYTRPEPGTLFAPASRAADPATSKAAERRMLPKRGTMASRVYHLLLAYPKGLTAQEVERFLTYKDLKTGKPVTGWWKRLSDLKHAGLAEATGGTRDGGEVMVAVPLDRLRAIP